MAPRGLDEPENSRGEIIAYHARARRACERAAGRPWEMVAGASPPKALINHAEVEARLAEIVESRRQAESSARLR
jgi:hypothetical protein